MSRVKQLKTSQTCTFTKCRWQNDSFSQKRNRTTCPVVSFNWRKSKKKYCKWKVEKQLKVIKCTKTIIVYPVGVASFLTERFLHSCSASVQMSSAPCYLKVITWLTSTAAVWHTSEGGVRKTRSSCLSANIGSNKTFVLNLCVCHWHSVDHNPTHCEQLLINKTQFMWMH